MGKRKTKKVSNVVTFDEEIIRKDTASSLLAKIKAVDGNSEEVTEETNGTNFVDNQDGSETQGGPTEGRMKRKKGAADASSGTLTPKKQKKRTVDPGDASTEDPPQTKTSDDEGSSEDDPEGIDDRATLPAKTEESKRALKRKKHAKLLEDKKMEAELKSQGGALNYLSKWKYSRDEWKFEKVKQMWLQQHMFDRSRVPEESWETTVDYFCGSKGAIRKTVTDAALKIIEEAEKEDENVDDEERGVKLRRAREIVQRLV